MEHYGMSWALIAKEMATRTADRRAPLSPKLASRLLMLMRVECSKRWQHCLDPKLDYSNWTEQEVR